jgi:GNAT superfamily N-acetyltransferase
MTAAPLQISQATEKDIPLIVSFIRELAEYEREIKRVLVTEEVLRASLFGEHAYAQALIVRADEEPVAFALYFFSFSSFYGGPNLYLEDIFVRASARGLGVGKQLMAHLARIANERGCGRMEWAVLNWNESAIQFYRGLGAEPVTDWTVFHLGKEQLDELAEID